MHALLTLAVLAGLSTAQEDFRSSTSTTTLMPPPSDDVQEEVAGLRKQVLDMVGEIRNQNQALFKQADLNRILSDKVVRPGSLRSWLRILLKVSDLSKQVKSLRQADTRLDERAELSELRAAKRDRKIKAKVKSLSDRLGQ